MLQTLALSASSAVSKPEAQCPRSSKEKRRTERELESVAENTGPFPKVNENTCLAVG